MHGSSALEREANSMRSSTIVSFQRMDGMELPPSQLLWVGNPITVTMLNRSPLESANSSSGVVIKKTSKQLLVEFTEPPTLRANDQGPFRMDLSVNTLNPKRAIDALAGLWLTPCHTALEIAAAAAAAIAAAGASAAGAAGAAGAAAGPGAACAAAKAAREAAAALHMAAAAASGAAAEAANDNWNAHGHYKGSILRDALLSPHWAAQRVRALQPAARRQPTTSCVLKCLQCRVHCNHDAVPHNHVLHGVD